MFCESFSEIGCEVPLSQSIKNTNRMFVWIVEVFLITALRSNEFHRECKRYCRPVPALFAIYSPAISFVLSALKERLRCAHVTSKWLREKSIVTTVSKHHKKYTTLSLWKTHTKTWRHYLASAPISMARISIRFTKIFLNSNCRALFVLKSDFLCYFAWPSMRRFYLDFTRLLSPFSTTTTFKSLSRPPDAQ